MTPDQARQHVTGIVKMFEHLTPASVDTFEAVYAQQARFKDPFNEVTGVPAIRRIFLHMYEVMEGPRFVVRSRVVQAEAAGAQCFLTWDFHFRLKRWARHDQLIHGGSYLQLDEQGRIVLHRDYWDAAEELYAKLPVIGALMRWLQRRART